MARTVTFPWLPAGAAAAPETQFGLSLGESSEFTLQTASAVGFTVPISGKWVRVGDMVSISISGVFDNSTWSGAKDPLPVYMVLPFAGGATRQYLAMTWGEINDSVPAQTAVSAYVDVSDTRVFLEMNELTAGTPNTYSPGPYLASNIQAGGTTFFSLSGTYIAASQ